MEFDWNQLPFDLTENGLSTVEIEESFEDPFSVKILPDSSAFGSRSRYFNIGRSVTGKNVISVYSTNGKVIRIIHSRECVHEETYFYLKQMNESLMA